MTVKIYADDEFRGEYCDLSEAQAAGRKAKREGHTVIITTEESGTLELQPGQWLDGRCFDRLVIGAGLVEGH